MPVGGQPLALFGFHAADKTFDWNPVGGDLHLVFPVAGMQPGQIGRAQRGSFRNGRQFQRNIQQIRLELHQKSVGSGSAVRPQQFDSAADIGFECGDKVGALERDALQRRPCDMGRIGAAGDPQNRTSGFPILFLLGGNTCLNFCFL